MKKSTPRENALCLPCVSKVFVHQGIVKRVDTRVLLKVTPIKGKEDCGKLAVSICLLSKTTNGFFIEFDSYDLKQHYEFVPDFFISARELFAQTNMNRTQRKLFAISKPLCERLELSISINSDGKEHGCILILRYSKADTSIRWVDQKVLKDFFVFDEKRKRSTSGHL